MDIERTDTLEDISEITGLIVPEHIELRFEDARSSDDTLSTKAPIAQLQSAGL